MPPKKRKHVKRSKITFYLDAALYRKFRLVAVKRGHTMTWYLTGCINEVVRGERGRVRHRIKKGGVKREAAQT